MPVIHIQHHPSETVPRELRDEVTCFFLATIFAGERVPRGVSNAVGRTVMRNELLVAHSGSQLIGAATFETGRHAYRERDVTHTHVEYIASAQSWRGRGIGRILMREVQAQGIESGDAYVSAIVAPENPARQFYEAYGFRVDDNCHIIDARLILPNESLEDSGATI